MSSDSEHKMCVVVLFGGMSSEHEVSRVSAGTFVDQHRPPAATSC